AKGIEQSALLGALTFALSEIEMSEEKHKMHVTETPDTSHIKNVDVTHEQSDVQIGGIAKFIIGLSILTIVTFIAVWGMFMLFQKTATTQEQETHRSPIAM